MRSFLTLIAICALTPPAAPQDLHDWQAVEHLQAGDSLRLSLKVGKARGEFQSWTPQQLTAGNVTAKREDVLKIVRFGPGHTSRAKSAAIGALIGFGGGYSFALATTPACGRLDFFCPVFSTGYFRAGMGGLGAIIGGGIGVFLPRHTRTLVYSAK